MDIYALANSREESWELHKAMGLTCMRPYAHRQAHIKSNKIHAGVYFWEEDAPPDFSSVNEICHLQGSDSIESFIHRVKSSQQVINEDKQHVFNTQIKPAFPKFDFYFVEYAYSWRVRYNNSNGNTPVILDRWEREKTLTKLTIKRMKRLRESKLVLRFPFLVFFAGSMPDYPEYIEWAKPKLSQSSWCCWVLRDYGDGKRRGGANAGFSFAYPPTKDDIKTLDELNSEAGKSQPDEMFFCSSCKKALPRDQYGYFHFAAVKCKSCASPEWLKMAKNESYN